MGNDRLEPTVRHRIQERYQQMHAEGKLLSRPQLDQFYKTFRDRFGPDKLVNLDGEALLETVHAHGNKDTSDVNSKKSSGKEEASR